MLYFKYKFKIWKNLMLKFLIFIVYGQYIGLTNAVKFSTAPICLSEDNAAQTKIICEDKTTSLFISLVQYTDDYLNQCGQVDSNQSSYLNLTNQSIKQKSLKNKLLNRCSAYPTQELARKCNGYQECMIKLIRPDFDFGFMGSNCKFRAKILSISYECLPTDFNLPTIPKYNICPGNKIDHPIFGFIHSPNYPNAYDSKKFCQFTLKVEEHIQRLEIFLIDMEVEDLSTRTYKPTDYLQINSKEKLFGIQKHTLIYNDTKDATLVFSTDQFFNKRGFLLYFQAISKPLEEIDLYEDLDSFEIEPTKTIITSTTTSIVSTNTNIQIFNFSNQTNNNHTNINTNYTQSIFNITVNTATQESKINVNDMVSTARYVRIESVTQSDQMNALISDYTVKAILTLIGLTFILSSIIIFLLLTNRKRFFNSVMNYKAAEASNNAHFYDASLVNSCLDTNSVAGINGSIVLTHSNSNLAAYWTNLNQAILPPYKLNKNNPKKSDDSLKLLIINNKSLNQSIETSVLPGKSIPLDESYEEITLKSADKILTPIKRKESERQITQNLSTSKVNEYCYIQANGLVTGGPEQTNNVGCSYKANIDMFDSKLTPPASIINSPKSNDSLITSTPCVPKSLPPSISVIKNEQPSNSNEYDALNKNTTLNVYRSCFEDTDIENTSKTIVASFQEQTDLSNTLVDEKDIEEENNNDYQIPLNKVVD